MLKDQTLKKTRYSEKRPLFDEKAFIPNMRKLSFGLQGFAQAFLCLEGDERRPVALAIRTAEC